MPLRSVKNISTGNATVQVEYTPSPATVQEQEQKQLSDEDWGRIAHRAYVYDCGVDTGGRYDLWAAVAPAVKTRWIRTAKVIREAIEKQLSQNP